MKYANTRLLGLATERFERGFSWFSMILLFIVYWVQSDVCSK